MYRKDRAAKMAVSAAASACQSVRSRPLPSMRMVWQQVDEAKCVACGKCVRECPKQVIHIHECANYIVVRCSNRAEWQRSQTGLFGQLYRLRYL